MISMTLYIDLDGVLADFDRGAKVFGFDTSTLNKSRDELDKEEVSIKENLYDAIAFSKFYAELPFMPGGKGLWNALKPYGPFILTAAPSFRHRQDAQAAHQDAAEKKRLWCQNYLKINDPDSVICTLSWKKYLFVDHHGPAERAILIDDRAKNIGEWEEAGGIGILHHSTQTTLWKLQKYLRAFDANEENTNLSK